MTAPNYSPNPLNLLECLRDDYQKATTALKRLAAENRRLREVLAELVEMCDHVPIFQLDNGKASVKAVRLAGKFTVAMDKARAALKGSEEAKQ